MRLIDVDRARFRGKRVGVVTGGVSAEREVSLKTGRAFADALVNLGYEVEVFDVPAELKELARAEVAAVVLGIHGHAGENGVLQGYLEMMRIPYTGSGVMASAVAMDKGRAKAVLGAAGVASPLGVCIASARAGEALEEVRRVGLAFPVVVKPNDGGSSYGVTICDDVRDLTDAVEELAASGRGVLVEELVDGPEYTVGFFDEVCLGAIEVVAEGEFYDYEAKYRSERTRYAVVEDEEVLAELELIGRQAYNALGCRGVARVDLKSSGVGELKVLEVNTIPGMTETSLVPKLAAERGLSFEDFTECMLATAACEMSWS